MTMKCLLPVIAVWATYVAGCSQPVPDKKDSVVLSKWIGQNILIQFRRDALGAGRELPISPDTDEINGASTSIVGKLIAVSETSVVIQRKDDPHWVPRETILFIRVNP